MVGGNVPDIICPLESFKCNEFSYLRYCMSLVWSQYLLYRSNSCNHSSPSPASVLLSAAGNQLDFLLGLFLLQTHWEIIIKTCSFKYTDKSFYIAKINSTYPLSTPRTRFNIKKEPTTISGIKKTQLNTVPRASFV